MSTQFFERQETQRSHTRWLVLGFAIAFLLVTVVINVVILVGLFGDPRPILAENPQFVVWISFIVILAMMIAVWRKSSQLRAGGAVVARSLGGVPVTANDSDPKRKRLHNIVEEMAIAARIRKPMVFVLPEEPGINAFAAGHSPDEAAVAVTQGALDKLDRDQLQAVIGHEFSHILNGDMRINMRMTVWLFGLMMLTDVATRIMRGRGSGKGSARIKLVALGVFIAGSVGLLAGRLLQAAVSRRREHLADASAVQFTRNPGALQGAFVVMAADLDGSRLRHAGAASVAHMFFGHSEASWTRKLGTSWFSTHPPLEERVRAIDPRVSDVRFRLMVSDERRKLAARTKQEEAGGHAPANAEARAADQAGQAGGSAAAPDTIDMAAHTLPTGLATSMVMASQATTAAASAPVVQARRYAKNADELALAETLPSGVRLIAGKALPPDLLRHRLPQEWQAAIANFLAQVEKSPVTIQAVFVAAMLAAEPAKGRTQLTRLAPLLGVELMKETQAMVARVNALAPAARLPMLSDLLGALESLDAAERKRLRAVARAFAPTVAPGDMLRYAVTRLLEKRLARAVAAESTPIPLTDCAPAVCEIFAALAQCRFGVDADGHGAYRAGLMGLLPPQKWSALPEARIGNAQLDAALTALEKMHPAGKRSFADGMARVIAVGGLLTVSQEELLRTTCQFIGCPVPALPADLESEDAVTPRAAGQVSAR